MTKSKAAHTKSYTLVSPLPFEECLERLRHLEVQHMNTVITCDLDDSTPFPTFEIYFGNREYNRTTKAYWLRGSIRPLEGGTLIQVEQSPIPLAAKRFMYSVAVIFSGLYTIGILNTEPLDSWTFFMVLCGVGFYATMTPVVLTFMTGINKKVLLNALKNTTKSFEAVRKDKIKAVT